MSRTLFTGFAVRLGHCAIVYRLIGDTPEVVRIVLSDREETALRKVAESLIRPAEGGSGAIEELIPRIKDYFEGARIEPSMDLLDTSACTPFQLRVLRAARAIPRGKTASYAWLAKRLHDAKRARPVGQALARNPFPIVMPCHRTIRSNREVGLFQAGENVKRKMLALEGVRFDSQGRVVPGDFLDLHEAVRADE